MLFSKKPIFNAKGEISFYFVNVSNNTFFSSSNKNNVEDNVSIVSIFDDETNMAFFNNKPLIMPLISDEIDSLLSLEKKSDKIISYSMKDVDLEIVKKVKSNGFELLINDYVFEKSLIPYLEVSDYMMIDTILYSNDYVRKIVEKFEPLGIKYVADKVDSWEKFDTIKEYGLEFFTGNYFAKPAVVELKTESVNKLSFIKLLNEVSAPEVEMKNLAKIIKNDPTLTFGLLKKINSAFYGLSNNISSIETAISLLGLDEIKRWVYILNSKKMVSNKPIEILILALSRAIFLESLSKAFSKSDSFNYYLTGFLSTIDAILDIPMSRAIDEIMVDDKVKRALLGEENLYKLYLDCVKNIEDANWQDLELFLLENDLGVDELKKYYIDANKNAVLMLND